MSLPFDDMSRNSWKYHFDSVLSRFHLLINIASNLVQVNKIFFSFCNFSFFFYYNNYS